MTDFGNAKYVERIVEEAPESEIKVEYFLILYENRPLQVVPPASEGPHLIIFSREDKANAFIRERRKYFGEEPLSIASHNTANRIHSILKAPSLDPRYKGPPCGLIFNFNYKTQGFEKVINPQAVEEISFGDLAIKLGEQTAFVDSLPLDTHEIKPVSSEGTTHPEDVPLGVKTKEGEQSRPKQPRKITIPAGGILSLLLIAIGLSLFLLLPVIQKYNSISSGSSSGMKPNSRLHTATPLLQPTFTPTAVPEIILLRTDDFSDPFSGWDRYEEEGFGKINYSDGIYEILAESAEHGYLGLFDKIYSNIQIEITARRRSGPSDSSYGLACRLTPDLGGYAFLVSPYGSYAIGKWVGDDWIQIVDWRFYPKCQMCR
jgi:hypothetical protein